MINNFIDKKTFLDIQNLIYKNDKRIKRHLTGLEKLLDKKNNCQHKKSIILKIKICFDCQKMLEFIN